MKGLRRNSRMAPYFVQMRELERRLILGALEATEGSVADAAAILGVHQQYLKVRGMLLGGVFGNDPKHEPPKSAAEVWNASYGTSEDGEDEVDDEPVTAPPEPPPPAKPPKAKPKKKRDARHNPQHDGPGVTAKVVDDHRDQPADDGSGATLPLEPSGAWEGDDPGDRRQSRHDHQPDN